MLVLWGCKLDMLGVVKNLVVGIFLWDNGDLMGFGMIRKGWGNNDGEIIEMKGLESINCGKVGNG